MDHSEIFSMSTSPPVFAPQIAVILPIYGHPVLLSEAVESLLAQKGAENIAIVIVSDGCKLAETDLVCSAYSAAYRNIVYLRKKNGGPSSARNYGINYVLATWAGVAAVYFLDADNRLTATALADAYRALVNNPHVGWIFPNINSFGIIWSANYSIPYSPLLHIVHDNICDTGSLVARRVLESGVRFDEDARSGYEDWDFWLQCLAHGFIGHHAPFGFSYRQRPESRYREMNRQRPAMIDHLRKRHWAIASPRNLLRLEHETNPRYLYADPASDRYRAFTDPTHDGESFSMEEVATQYFGALRHPDEYMMWPYFVFAGRGAIQCLTDAKLLHGVFALMERESENAQWVKLVLIGSEGDIGVSITPVQKGVLWPESDPAALYLCRAQVLMAFLSDLPDGPWTVDVIEIKVSEPSFRANEIAGQEADDLAPAVLKRFLDAMVAHPFRKGSSQRWNWRPKHFPARHEYYAHMCQYMNVKRVMPRLSSGQLEVGVVVPIASFGGAEKVAYAMARYLRQKKNARVHLYVLGKPVMKELSEFRNAFDTISFLADPDFPTWGGPLQIFGQECFTPEDDALRVSEVAGMMTGLDLVINCHSAPMNALMGRLRLQEHAKTATYLHVFDSTPLKRPVGHPYLTVAFEHAYDLVLTCSRLLADELHCLGIPEGKIMAIPNAAGFSVPKEKRLAVEKSRRTARRDRPLRIVYIGRLDPQKGIERVLDIARRTQKMRLPVVLRVVGASLLDGVGGWAGALSAAGVEIEPPIYDSAELAEVFAWADVLLLPSRWEGAPLVIPECQQLGCIPLATNVGAVNELIDDGVDGFLIRTSDDTQVADEAIRAMKALIDNDELRKGMANAANKRAHLNQWDANFEPLGRWIDETFAVADFNQ